MQKFSASWNGEGHPDLAEQKAIAAKARCARSAMIDAELELLDLVENLLG